jgi:hypothetical protein
MVAAGLLVELLFGAVSLVPAQLATCLAVVLVDEGPLGTHHAELVALGVGKNGPGLGAGLPVSGWPGGKAITGA